MNHRLALPLAALSVLAATAAPAAQGQGGRPYTVAMTGAAERPGPGDPDGSGTATFRVNAGQGRVCYTLTVSNIDPATAAISTARRERRRPVVVPLTAPPAAPARAAPCDARAGEELIAIPAPLRQRPNAAFPPGAIRGQLSRSRVPGGPAPASLLPNGHSRPLLTRSSGS